MLAHDVEANGLTSAYTVWRKDASLDAARRTERDVALTVIWWGRDGERWAHHGTLDDVLLPPRLVAAVGARDAADPALAHFYAIESSSLDDPDLPMPDRDWLARAAPTMRDLLRAGRLVE